MADVRLIDANALRQKIEKWAAEADNSISFVDSVEGFAYDEVLDAIDAAPTVTALGTDTKENNPFAEEGVIECQFCRSGEWLYNEDGAPNAFCGQCGHRIIWPEASEEAAARRTK